MTATSLSTLSTSTSARSRESVKQARTSSLWASVLAACLLLLYAPMLKQLALQWWTDPEYGHGFLIPVVSGYVLWRERRIWLGKRHEPSNFGLLVMAGAIALLLLGSLGAELFLSRYSLIVLLAGMVLFLAGWGVLRAVSFPLAYLSFMVPIPVILYNQITFPLQLLASRLATFWLDLVHVPVLRDGNILIFSNYSLEVVEACSGIRSLITFVALVVAYGYLIERRFWIRGMLVILMVPIAIFSNAIRIVGAGVAAHGFGPNAAAGFLHEFSSAVIFTISLLLMFSCHWLLRRIRSASDVHSNA
jgi:exosortase